MSRGRRLDLGWTQVEVARRAGVSRKWVSGFETGKTGADLPTVLRLLDILGIRLEAETVTGPAILAAPGRTVDLDEILGHYLRRR